MTARDTARTATERRYVEVLELDLDRCSNTYGVAPCTAAGAAGTECYNTFQTCQAKTAFVKSFHTYKFISRGAPIPPGELVRPYITTAKTSPTVADPDQGLARRAMVAVALVDEPDSDVEQDPYVANRATPAGSTFWRRLLARNKNYAGRPARLLRGYATSPWDWSTLQTERYIIDNIAGPDKSGAITVTLKDPIKLADQVQVPPPTAGKLSVVLPDYEDRGYAQSGTLSTIQLATTASSVDGAYVGMAVRIDDQTAAGEERVISAYVGSTRTATVSTNWAVAPDNTSLYSIHHLQAVLGAGDGAQYDIYGYPCWVRMGDEIVRVTSRATDTLKWDTSADRVQFNTPLKAHKANEAVQLCKVFSDTPITDVIISLANEAGLSSTYIDTALLADQESTWFGANYRITTALSSPEKISTYLKELAIEMNSVIWWSPVSQKLKLMAINPQSAVSPPELTATASIIKDSFDKKILDDERLTEVCVNYDLVYATADKKLETNYLGGELYIDADAESANEFNDVRPDIIYSRWYGSANAQAARDLAGRRLNRRRNSPISVSFRIDPKDGDFDVGDQRDITVPGIVDTAGNEKKTRILVTRYDDQGGSIYVEGRATDFERRWAFIAPNGTPDYPTDTVYAHICLDTGLMPDGTDGYLII